MTLRAALSEGLRRLPRRVHTWLPADQRADLRHRLGTYRAWEVGVDLTPPPPPPGEATGPPDFVSVGAELCGVRWWSDLVADHPAVSTRTDTALAPNYLSHFATRHFGEQEVRAYHRWYPRAEGMLAGEWAPCYLAYPWVAPLAAMAAPDARLLVMLRDPVERLRLGIVHAADDRALHVGASIADAVERGFYARQLRQWMEFFPPEQVLVLQYERCVVDPEGQLAATYEFLGLDPGRRPAGGFGPDRTTVGSGDPLVPGAAERLVAMYAADVEDLAGLVPGFDRRLWPHFEGNGPSPTER